MLVGAASGASGGSRAAVLETQFRSVALGGVVHATVVLPRDYASGRERYPVVYFLHGLPAGAAAHRDVGWLADALAAAGGPAILVAPQGARVGDTDAEYLDWGPGRNWETYLTRELPREVDARFRTIPSRRGRAIVGLSAGGYGAAILALRHLSTFSVAESWSGYFHPTDPSGTRPLARGRATSAHTYVTRLRAAFRRDPTFLAFYVGTDDKRFRAENELLDRELDAARVPHVFRVYRGGHETAVWRAHAAGWLRLALAHLEEAQPRHNTP
jgi:S-formylglutathione hydrolase FrmB